MPPMPPVTQALLLVNVAIFCLDLFVGPWFGRLFALYLATYGIFRFFSEFLRETEKPYGGLSAYQLMCIAMVIVGGTALLLRTIHQPPSWDRWKNLRASS